MRLVFALLLALPAASCQQQRPPPANPHYVLGEPYQADGVWYYPAESYQLQETGIATVYASGHGPFTADGEAFSQAALAAAHQTLQLPAVARLTNLGNGLEILVRINDRGPASPHRVVEVTRRVASLLGFADQGAVRVRLEVLPVESQAAVDAVPGAPRLDIAVAPVGAVQESDLPPLGSALQVGSGPSAHPEVKQPAPIAPVLQLPEVATQGTPDPGRLFVKLGTFQSYRNAGIQRARVAGLGADIVSRREGRVQTHRVMIGPLSDVPQADMVLDQVLRSGVTDARIVVE